jgi:hypothetical protein
MANTLGNYNVQYYAREALAWLRAKKGIARLINRTIEGERKGSWEQGEVVNIRRPKTFTAAEHVAGTGTTAQDVKGQNVQITLDQHYETKYKLTDREIAYGGPKLVQEFIGPAVDSVIEKIESTVFGLGAKIGPSVDISAATAAEDMIVPGRKKLVENRTPTNDLHFAIDPGLEATFLADPIFHQAQVVGQGNQSALMDGSLGRRFGINIFASQLAKRVIAQQTATLAAAAGTGDEVGAINNASGYDVNTSSGIVIDALTNSETLAVNVDTFTIAGDPTTYVVTAVSGAVTSNAVTISCYPPLQAFAADNAVVTFNNRFAIQDAAAGTTENLMFHRNALALVMAPLGMEGNGAGAEIYTATDEESGLSIRVRKFYDGDTASVSMAVDALWGVQVLNSQMAVRVLRATA